VKPSIYDVFVPGGLPRVTYVSRASHAGSRHPRTPTSCGTPVLAGSPFHTAVTAGSGDPAKGGVWARIPAEVTVTPNPEEPRQGKGFPRLLLTGRDIDPATDEVREGDPDAPCLWQDPSDYVHSVWWLNLQNPEGAFAFGQREQLGELWRHFHVSRVMEMVTQVLMQNEFTRRGEDERQAYWADHKQALDRHDVQTVQQMWDALEPYVRSGEGLS